MLLIFTDLDGTLLNQEDYAYDAAVPELAALQAAHIPVIPVTSKTRLEVEHLRQAIALTDPFIVENGSGIFIPPADDRFTHLSTEPWHDYQRVALGCTYRHARAGLKEIAAALETTLTGFGDLSPLEIQQLTGLSPEEARRAQQREFSEPFVTPQDRSPDALRAAVEAAGFRVVVGDRFSHLIGAEAGKGVAVQQLIQAYQAQYPDQPLTTIGLGNSPNDLPMLEAVDHPIVIPTPRGAHYELADRGWEIAPEPGCKGWATAVSQWRDRAKATV